MPAHGGPLFWRFLGLATEGEFGFGCGCMMPLTVPTGIEWVWAAEFSLYRKRAVGIVVSARPEVLVWLL